MFPFTSEVKTIPANEELIAGQGMFDTEYVHLENTNRIIAFLRQYFGNKSFSILDIGGGSGLFLDNLLGAFPASRGMLVDASKFLINKNKENARKELVYSEFFTWAKRAHNKVEKFDLINMNWILHHLVASSYRLSVINIKEAIQIATSLCSINGIISIYEQCCNGIIIDNLPGYLIYCLTSSNLIKPIIRKCGALSAGVGVCFQSKLQWKNIFKECQLKVECEHDDVKWKPQPWDMLLNLKDFHDTHFILKPC
ncbi:MAG: class I SAM-dependent methyltransferase [Desulfobaccales bacterium]